MADKSYRGAERSEKLLDALAEYIENAPGQELLEDARLEGRDPEQIAEHVKGVLERALKSHSQANIVVPGIQTRQ